MISVRILDLFCLLSLSHISILCLVPQLHKQADMQEEKNRIERVLGAISAPDLIQKVLTFALSVHMTTITACHNFGFILSDRGNETKVTYQQMCF